MKNIVLLPSLLSANFANLSADVKVCENAGADGLHCDIMDGHYVPNITFGPLVVDAVKKSTKLPLDVHLMIEKPELYIDNFVKAGADTLTVHVETCPHVHRTLQQIKDYGIRCGVSLNPSTPICMIENIIKDMDFLLIMTVNPGFGGQSFIESMLDKIKAARQMAESAGKMLDIGVDGGIDSKTAPLVVSAGANVLIAGSSVFAHPDGVDGGCRAIRDSLDRV
ncbi:MAG: ribulose-phosphate 3-epimerase [Armatimonadota bacterium]